MMHHKTTRQPSVNHFTLEASLPDVWKTIIVNTKGAVTSIPKVAFTPATFVATTPITSLLHTMPG